MNNDQQGIALITSLLIASLITASAVSLANNQQLFIRKVEYLIDDVQKRIGTDDLESIARNALTLEFQKNRNDSYDDTWHHKELALSRRGIAFDGKLYDLQSRLNINNLASRQGAIATAGSTTNQSVSASSASAAVDLVGDAAATVGLVGDAAAVNSASNNLTSSSAGNDGGGTVQKRAFDLERATQCSEAAGCSDEYYERHGIELVDRERILRTRGLRDPQDPNYQAFLDNDSSGGNISNRSATDDPSVSPTSVASDDGTVATLPGAPGSTEKLKLSQAQLAELRLKSLLTALDIPIDILPAILDWIDADSETRYPNGAEDEYYTGLTPAYRAANRPLASARELMLIRGVDEEIYRRLVPYITTMQRTLSINVNTASADVLQSLSPLIDDSTAEMLINARKVRPFETIDEFLAHPILIGRDIQTEGISTSSEYFELIGTVNASSTSSTWQSILRRSNNNTETVSRKFSVLQ